MRAPIYLDNHSTTPLDPRVLEAMLPYLQQDFGNAASRQHVFGWRAEAAVEQAREATAEVIGADPKEILFTSGATESNNMAILGLAQALRSQGDHIVTAATEHRSVLDPCLHLRELGFRVTVLPVDRLGRVDPDQVRAHLDVRTILISIMAANNEVGTLQPLADIGKLAKEKGIIFHSDAAQALGKMPLNVETLGIDLLSISAHKVYGPKGSGALYVRRRAPRVTLHPIIFGGGHERGLRSGTLNVPGVVGLGRALSLANESLSAEAQKLAALRDELFSKIAAGVADVVLNGHPTERLCNNLSLSFPGLTSEALMREVPELAVSAGSACTSAEPRLSHVLQALGLEDALTKATLRFGLGRFNTRDEIEFAAQEVVRAVKTLRHSDVARQVR